MLKCVSPRCPLDADAIIVGFSLCDDHRAVWEAVERHYHSQRSVDAMQEMMAEFVGAVMPPDVAAMLMKDMPDDSTEPDSD